MTGRHATAASGTDAPPAPPAPAVDGRVWRTFGDPLVAATGTGPLQGMSVAVKDLFALEGFATGAGSEEWLAEARPETTTAAAPAALLAAGAVVAGIARTDEFAYSLAGTNTHYGTPPNPKAPDRISGGSSSGSASAVSLGQATIGLGTDTGGSIRVPAAYQGLYGIRTTHGAVSVRGLLPLAPSFDTVGWMTRDAGTLAAVGSVLLPAGQPEAQPPGGSPQDAPVRDATLQEARFAPELLALAEPDVRAAVEQFLDGWGPGTGTPPLERTGFRMAELPGWLSAFQTVQATRRGTATDGGSAGIGTPWERTSPRGSGGRHRSARANAVPRVNCSPPRGSTSAPSWAAACWCFPARRPWPFPSTRPPWEARASRPCAAPRCS